MGRAHKADITIELYPYFIMKSRKVRKKITPSETGTFMQSAVYAEKTENQTGVRYCMRRWSLAELPVGRTAVLEQIVLDARMRLRLLELGFVPGTQVRCMHRAPAGSPAAYLVRGAVIAIRKSDAAKILTGPWG